MKTIFIASGSGRRVATTVDGGRGGRRRPRPRRPGIGAPPPQARSAGPEPAGRRARQEPSAPRSPRSARNGRTPPDPRPWARTPPGPGTPPAADLRSVDRRPRGRGTPATTLAPPMNPSRADPARRRIHRPISPHAEAASQGRPSRAPHQAVFPAHRGGAKPHDPVPPTANHQGRTRPPSEGGSALCAPV